MSLQVAAPAGIAPELPAHAHHWMIASQNGPSSEGTCKDCGETRDFENGYSRTYRTTVFLGSRARAQAPAK